MLCFFSALILFLSFLAINGFLNFSKGKLSWYREHDYYRQVTFINADEDKYPDLPKRTINIKQNLVIEIGDMSRQTDIGFINTKSFHFLSDLNSGFSIDGKNELLENEAFISSDLLQELGLGSSIQSFQIKDGDKTYEFSLVGVFDQEFSSYLKSKLYPDIICFSHMKGEMALETVEFGSLTDIKKAGDDEFVLSYEMEIRSIEASFSIVSIIMLILFIFMAFLSSSSLTLMVTYLVTENNKTIIILNAMGTKKKYFRLVLLGKVAIFNTLVTIAALVCFFLFKFVLKNLRMDFTFIEVDLFHMNLLSLLLLYLTGILIYYFVACRSLDRAMRFV